MIISARIVTASFECEIRSTEKCRRCYAKCTILSVCRWLVGRSYCINWMDGANDCQVSSRSSASGSCTLTISSWNQDIDYLLYGSDNSVVVLNVKEKAWVGQKTATAYCSLMSSVDSIDDDLLLGRRSSLLWPALWLLGCRIRCIVRATYPMVQVGYITQLRPNRVM